MTSAAKKRTSSEFPEVKKQSNDWVENVSPLELNNLFATMQVSKKPKSTPNTIQIKRQPKTTLKSTLAKTKMVSVQKKIINNKADGIKESLWKHHSQYLASKLQNAILSKDKIRKEKSATEVLVHLKKEYEKDLKLNTDLKEQILKIQSYTDSIETLVAEKSHTKVVQEVLHKNQFTDRMDHLSGHIQAATSTVELVGVDAEEVKECLGLNSEAHARLKHCNEFIKDHKEIMRLMGEVTQDIAKLLQEKVELKKRCDGAVEHAEATITEQLYQKATKNK